MGKQLDNVQDSIIKGNQALTEIVNLIEELAGFSNVTAELDERSGSSVNGILRKMRVSINKIVNDVALAAESDESRASEEISSFFSASQSKIQKFPADLGIKQENSTVFPQYASS